jgi:hypothetical protein
MTLIEGPLSEQLVGTQKKTIGYQLNFLFTIILVKED